MEEKLKRNIANVSMKNLMYSRLQDEDIHSRYFSRYNDFLTSTVVIFDPEKYYRGTNTGAELLVLPYDAHPEVKRIVDTIFQRFEEYEDENSRLVKWRIKGNDYHSQFDKRGMDTYTNLTEEFVYDGINVDRDTYQDIRDSGNGLVVSAQDRETLYANFLVDDGHSKVENYRNYLNKKNNKPLENYVNTMYYHSEFDKILDKYRVQELKSRFWTFVAGGDEELVANIRNNIEESLANFYERSVYLKESPFNTDEHRTMSAMTVNLNSNSMRYPINLMNLGAMYDVRDFVDDKFDYGIDEDPSFLIRSMVMLDKFRGNAYPFLNGIRKNEHEVLNSQAFMRS